MTGGSLDGGSSWAGTPGWATHPDLGQVGASMREEWREERETAGREAAAEHRHTLTLRDLLVECMHRGDRLTVSIGPHRFTGTVAEVGPDLLAVQTVGSRIDVHLHPSVPLLVQIAERTGTGGHGAPAGSGDFRAALIAREDADEVTVGTTFDLEPLDGRLLVGADHVTLVARGGAETIVPMAEITYVSARRD
jgi:hypothetical protein